VKSSKAPVSKVLFDTQVYIAYRFLIQQRDLEPGWHSVVVWQERMAGANDGNELRGMESECNGHAKEGRLLIPDREAWLMAGRILHRYLSDLRRQNPNKLRPALSHTDKQNLIRDVLIAVSAKKAGIAVVSDNKDFPTIQRYYDFKWSSAKAYFAV
jgi:predicted nucleic acid-binding protein